MYVEIIRSHVTSVAPLLFKSCVAASTLFHGCTFVTALGIDKTEHVVWVHPCYLWVFSFFYLYNKHHPKIPLWPSETWKKNLCDNCARVNFSCCCFWLWIYEKEMYMKVISTVINTTKVVLKTDWKKRFRPVQDLNPWPLWSWCSALPTEPTSQPKASHCFGS